MNVSPAGPTRADRGVALSADATASTAGSARIHRRLGLIGSAVAVLILMVGLFSGLAPAASAAGAEVNQCNGVYNTGGMAVECHVTINNVLNLATGVSTSSGTIQECHGAAGAALLCTTTPVTSLSTTVTQCNGSALGGGATLKCSVLVTNTITGNGTKSPATVNQCIGSGTGGGIEPTTQCTPVASTTNADITQCNGSANGGGASRRVKCTVHPSTETAALPITVNQCNGSTAGGSLVTCDVTIVNDFVTVPPTTTATATTTTGPTTGPTTATSTRPRPTGTVRPTIATRPTTAATVTTTARPTSRSRSGQATTSGVGTNARLARSTSSTNGVFTGANGTTSSSTTTTSLASTGVPAGRQALLAFALLSAGAGLMLVGRRPRWIGKHR